MDKVRKYEIMREIERYGQLTATAREYDTLSKYYESRSYPTEARKYAELRARLTGQANMQHLRISDMLDKQ